MWPQIVDLVFSNQFHYNELSLYILKDNYMTFLGPQCGFTLSSISTTFLNRPTDLRDDSTAGLLLRNTKYILEFLTLPIELL